MLGVAERVGTAIVRKVVNSGGELKGRDGQDTRPDMLSGRSVFFFPVVLAFDLGRAGKFALESLYANVTGGTTGVGGKGVGAVMADTTVFARIERLHGKFFWMFFGCTFAHFKGLIMAAGTVKPHVNMPLVLEYDRFHGNIKHNGLRLLHIATMADLAGFWSGGVERHFAIMAGTAVFAGIQGSHVIIALGLG